MGKSIIKWLLIPFILLSGIPAYSQSLAADGASTENDSADTADKPPAAKGDMWISLGIEMANFPSVPLGYSFALGYGKGASIGIKASYYPERENVSIMELTFLLRFYFLGTAAYSGPFLQLSGGPTLVSMNGGVDIPSELGVFSLGGAFGWRFLFIDRFFIEPSIRGGYPYMFGAGLSGGIRF